MTRSLVKYLFLPSMLVLHNIALFAIPLCSPYRFVLRNTLNCFQVMLDLLEYSKISKWLNCTAKSTYHQTAMSCAINSCAVMWYILEIGFAIGLEIMSKTPGRAGQAPRVFWHYLKSNCKSNFQNVPYNCTAHCNLMVCNYMVSSRGAHMQLCGCTIMWYAIRDLQFIHLNIAHLFLQF